MVDIDTEWVEFVGGDRWLTTEQAAVAVGVSVNHFRTKLDLIPHVRVGKRIRIPANRIGEVRRLFWNES